MADGTPIEWTDATWNPITGCSIVSPGCTNCYAMKLAGTRLQHHPSRAGLTRDTAAGPVWTGEVRFNEAWLDQPLRWSRPRMIFVCAHGDVFAEGVPDEWIDRVFAVMALAPHHTFQVLTKRADRMRAYLTDPRTPGRIARVLIDACLIDRTWPCPRDGSWPVKSIGDIDDPDDVTISMPLPNVWLGVSAEDQRRADERAPVLFDTPAAVRWISAEPLIGPIHFDLFRCPTHDFAGGFCIGDCPDRRGLDWIVAGGESGHGARPMHPEWVRSIRDQCAAAGVAFLFKQWGEWLDEQVATSMRMAPGPEMFDRFGAPRGNRWHPYEASDRNGSAMIRVGKKAAGRLLDGVTHDGFPRAAEVPFG